MTGYDAGGFKSITLLICTYRRPRAFSNLIASVKALQTVPGLDVQIVVVDNSGQPERESYVPAAVKDVPWPVHYVIENKIGYASARNAALRKGLETGAEVFAFTDDDMILSPDWMLAHLTSLAALGCDVVNGRIYGMRRRFAHGRVLKTCGAGNVSFRRHLVDPSGLHLKFDEVYNRLGKEDQAFFRSAVRSGAIIKKSDWPLIYNYFGDAPMPEAELLNNIATNAAMQRNRVAVLRRTKGFAPAAMAAAHGLIFGARSVGHYLRSAALFGCGYRDAGRRVRMDCWKEWMKMCARFAGLTGEIVNRQDVRRGDPPQTLD
ncbi:MAG: glycosyltransferase family A protein [Pseudomonadota bacterium]